MRGEVDVGLPGGDAVCVRSGGLATSGSILRSGSPVKQIVSMNGQAGDDQKVFVRADLLVDPQRVEATSFQMEYLPSGVVCRGLVTSVGPTSFVGTCRLPDGRPRHVDASWTIDETGTVNGTIRSHA